MRRCVNSRVHGFTSQRINMPDANDRKVSGGLLGAAWRPAGVLYLAFCLAGLAVGLWPEAVFVSRGIQAAPLPVLRILAVAQIAFALLVWPLVVLRRAQQGATMRYWAGAIVETGVFLLVAVPFYIAAAYFADAVAADVVRTAVYVACVWIFSLAAGAHLAGGRGGSIVMMLVLVSAALGLPAAHYIALEFGTVSSVALLGRISPATFAWTVSASRGASWRPEPLWAAIIWPAAGAALACLAMLLTKSDRKLKDR